MSRADGHRSAVWYRTGFRVARLRRSRENLRYAGAHFVPAAQGSRFRSRLPCREVAAFGQGIVRLLYLNSAAVSSPGKMTLDAPTSPVWAIWGKALTQTEGIGQIKGVAPDQKGIRAEPRTSAHHVKQEAPHGAWFAGAKSRRAERFPRSHSERSVVIGSSRIARRAGK